jgi:hypothetical protein
MTTQPLRSRADVLTDAPERYAKQLVAHLGRKIMFITAGSTSTATIAGATAQVTSGDGVLSMLVIGSDEPSVTRAEQVLGGHLERFGQRQQLTVAWTRGPPLLPVSVSHISEVARTAVLLI